MIDSRDDDCDDDADDADDDVDDATMTADERRRHQAQTTPTPLSA